jgi:hypothetical protein
MSTKNPFEIRSDVLAMAKDYMDKQYQLNLEMSQKMIEAGQKAIDDLPTMYTIEELTEKAKEMYSFVSKKD